MCLKKEMGLTESEEPMFCLCGGYRRSRVGRGSGVAQGKGPLRGPDSRETALETLKSSENLSKVTEISFLHGN